MRILSNLAFKTLFLVQVFFVVLLCTQSNGQSLLRGTESSRLKEEVLSIARELLISRFNAFEREMSNQHEILKMKLHKEETVWKQRYVELSQNVQDLKISVSQLVSEKNLNREHTKSSISQRNRTDNITVTIKKELSVLQSETKAANKQIENRIANLQIRIGKMSENISMNRNKTEQISIENRKLHIKIEEADSKLRNAKAKIEHNLQDYHFNASLKLNAIQSEIFTLRNSTRKETAIIGNLDKLATTINELTQNFSITNNNLELMLKEQTRQNGTIYGIVKQQMTFEKTLQRMKNDLGVTDMIYSGNNKTHTPVESEVTTTIENVTQDAPSFTSVPVVTFSSGTLPSSSTSIYINCKVTTMGTEYRGTVSVTVSGKLCQRWDSQNPHSHSMTSKFKEPVSIHENYCRNPDKDSGGPWCYTTDPSKRWEYCDIRMCDVTNMIYRGSEGTSTNVASIVTSTIKDDTQDTMSHSSAPAVTFSRGTLPPSSASSYMNCKATTMGKKYRGTVSVTISGIPCQRWDSQNPRSHSMASKFNEPASIHQNYCRNPDDDTGGPWCFTTYSSKTWEYCDIKMCDSLMTSEKTDKVTFLPTHSVSPGSEHLTTETHESSFFETTIYPFDDYQTTEITTSVSTHESTTIAGLSRASCTFELFEICFLENSIRDDFNWTTEKDSTPSSDTGPSSASGGLYYSYIEASDPRKSGETASLVSKEFIAGGQKCLLFDYHMRGNGIGTLKVFIIKGSAVDEIFSRSGEQGNNWVTAVIPLTSAENYKLRIDGTRGRNFRGDIAIDNVRVVPRMGNCGQLVMRLVGGNSKHEGRIEVYAQAKWGTICDDDFDNNDGLVVCRMLGFSRVLSVKGSAYFGQGTGSILMDDVACSGSESSIFQCTYKSAHNCGHSEDVGVRCE